MTKNRLMLKTKACENVPSSLELLIIVGAYLGLAGPLELGTEIGGGRSVADVRSFPAEGGGMSEK